MAIGLPLLGVIVAVSVLPQTIWTGRLAPMAEHLPGLRRTCPMAVAILLGLAVMHGMGLWDDRRGLSAGVNLAVQLLVAMVLALFFDMRVLSFLGHYGWWGAAGSVLVSVLWIVAVTNAMNMLDNMDGLSGGVGAIIAGLYLAATLVNGQWFVGALCGLLLGSLLGFLIFNFPPAKLFMGDAGSLVVGLMLAVVSVRTTYFAGVVSSSGAAGLVMGAPRNWYGVLMPLMVLAVPLYDLSSVTLIRVRQGRSPFTGDQNHFSHRLVRLGLSRRAAVVLIWLCTLATGLSGVMLGRLEAWEAMLAGAQSLAVISVLAILEWRHRSGSSDG